MRSPMTEYLKKLSEKLNDTKISVYFKLPDVSIKESFYVIGSHTGGDSRSAKFGTVIVDTTLQIDLFYPIDSRTKVEEATFQARVALNKQMTHQLLIDHSIGREVYHIIFRTSDLII